MSASPALRRIAALAVLAATGLPACNGGRVQEHPPGTLRTLMTSAPASLSLIGKVDRNGEVLASLVTDSLVKYDETLVARPRLAESWTSSPDGTTWTFKLREGVRWHDGTPVTAQDVVFTAGKVRDPATEAPSYLGMLEDVVQVEALDPKTVRVVYAAPRADALDNWTLPIVPEHLAGKEANLLTSEFARHPIGCGPFRFVRAETGREIVLEANPGFWGGRPALDRIVFRLLPNERTAFEALLRGEIDLMHVTPDLWREAQSSVRAGRFARFVYYRLDVWYVAWNMDGSNPFFADPGTRRAMVLALDRERFVSRVLGSLARPAVGTVHPDSAWFNRSLEPWPYDPKEATRLLEEAGWRDTDGDGVRDREGRPLAFTLTVAVSSQEIAERTAVWMQDSLSKIGVRMSIEKIDWLAFRERRREHRFEALMGALNFTPAPDQYEMYHSWAREHAMNWGGFHDDEVDRLLEQGRQTLDPDLRHEIYDSLQARLHELEPVSCLFHFAAPVLYDARLAGVKRNPLGFWATTPGVQAWHWAAEARRD